MYNQKCRPRNYAKCVMGADCLYCSYSYKTNDGILCCNHPKNINNFKQKIKNKLENKKEKESEHINDD